MLDFMRRQQIEPEMGLGDPHLHIQREPYRPVHPPRGSADRKHNQRRSFRRA